MILLSLYYFTLYSLYHRVSFYKTTQCFDKHSHSLLFFHFCSLFFCSKAICPIVKLTHSDVYYHFICLQTLFKICFLLLQYGKNETDIGSLYSPHLDRCIFADTVGVNNLLLRRK